MRPVERSKYISGRMLQWRHQCMNENIYGHMTGGLGRADDSHQMKDNSSHLIPLWNVLYFLFHSFLYSSKFTLAKRVRTSTLGDKGRTFKTRRPGVGSLFFYIFCQLECITPPAPYIPFYSYSREFERRGLFHSHFMLLHRESRRGESKKFPESFALANLDRGA